MSYLFLPSKQRRGARLALITCLLAFTVIMLGAYTRLTDAGLSCPDWPHCYGYLIAPHTSSQIADAAQRYPGAPVDTKKAWTEMTHRYFAGTEGILILLLAYSFWRYRPTPHFQRKNNLPFIALTLTTLLAVQILLGMLTVTEKLKPVIVLSHLITGLSILSVLWWAYLDLIWQNHRMPIHARVRAKTVRWVALGLMIVILQITLGGWTSSHYAGLACVDFPYCNGTLIPAMHWNALNSDLVTIHMLHRFGAFITGIYLFGLSIYLSQQRLFKVNAIKILILVSLQIIFGILTLYWLRPIWLALLHHMTAILLLLTMIATLVKAHYVARKYYDSRIA